MHIEFLSDTTSEGILLLRNLIESSLVYVFIKDKFKLQMCQTDVCGVNICANSFTKIQTRHPSTRFLPTYGVSTFIFTIGEYSNLF